MSLISIESHGKSLRKSLPPDFVKISQTELCMKPSQMAKAVQSSSPKNCMLAANMRETALQDKFLNEKSDSQVPEKFSVVCSKGKNTKIIGII